MAATILDLSVVVPVFNEEPVIAEMHRRLSAVLAGLGRSYEIILVDDGSDDRTRELARRLCANDTRTRLICFSRNFGHQFAITAGLDRSRGRAVIVIDADLQDPPEVIPDMIRKWEEGFDVVYARREKREGETWLKCVTARVFYRALKRLTAASVPLDTGDFRLIDRRVLEQFKTMRERARFVRGMISWVGFRQGEIRYVRHPRLAGETKYPLRKMLHFAADGLLSFSQAPLQLASALGLLSAGVSFVFIVYGLIQKYFFPQRVVSGWSSLFSAVLFLGGIQLICLGVVGAYVGRIYEEIKQRPLYIVDEEVNFE
jgi:glycosyltransferase involved in cell wall biosynthesis